MQANERSASSRWYIFILFLHSAQVPHEFSHSVVYCYATLVSLLDIYEDGAMFHDFY